jgi:hypothetical protein
MSFYETTSNPFGMVVFPIVSGKPDPQNIWARHSGVESVQAEMMGCIQETVPPKPLPGPIGTTVTILDRDAYLILRQEQANKPAWTYVSTVKQVSEAKEPVSYEAEYKYQFSMKSSYQWAQRHKTFFYDLSKELEQHSIKIIDQPVEMLSIQRSVTDWLEHLSKSGNFDKICLFARFFISEQIANRLTELHQAPYDPEEEEPLNSESVRLFIEYCRRKGLGSSPDIAVTPDGLIEADWTHNKEWVGMRFLSNGKIWVAIKKSASKGSIETTIDELFSPESNFRLPEWI